MCNTEMVENVRKTETLPSYSVPFSATLVDREERNVSNIDTLAFTSRYQKSIILEGIYSVANLAFTINRPNDVLR